MNLVHAVILASSTILLSSCASFGLNEAPGRDRSVYAACLVNQQQLKVSQQQTDDQTIGLALAHLATGLADGSALTRDQFGDKLALTEATEYDTYSKSNNPTQTIDEFILHSNTANNKPNNTTTPNGLPTLTADELRAREDSAFNEFLDCYLGPVDKIDYDGRLLRGHMALAVISAYLADVTKDAPTTQRTADAERGIHLLTDAELSLETSSPEMISTRGVKPAPAKPADGATPKQKPSDSAPKTQEAAAFIGTNDRFVMNIERVQGILSSAAFADDVFAQDIWSNFGGLITDIGSKLDINPWSAARDAAKAAVKTFERITLYENYEAAYFASAHNTLVDLHPNGIAQEKEPAEAAVQKYIDDFKGVGVKDWAVWDDYISAACHKLATFADASKTSCIPTSQQIYDALPPHIQALYTNPSDTANGTADTPQPSKKKKTS